MSIFGVVAPMDTLSVQTRLWSSARTYCQSDCRPRRNRLSERGAGIVLVRLAFWAFAIGIPFAGLTVLPIDGEEPRRAEVAREMIILSDWLVPRQQGQFYCTRPPLQNWCIAASALAFGNFSPFVVRFPSAVATCMTAIVCYLFARRYLGDIGGITAGTAYLTMGLPLTFGQRGETDPLFATFLGTSLLIFFSGYANQKKRKTLWWTAGLLCGLAALTKGVQGPVFYLACTAGFLIAQRHWQDILSREYFGSIASICLLALLWTVPYYRVAGWDHTYEIWFGQVEQRLVTSGLLQHLVYFPFATIVAMMPWSFLVFGYNKLRLREHPEIQQLVTYLAFCLAVTFVSLWFIPDAKPRYYLPLYPLVAVLEAVPFASLCKKGSERCLTGGHVCLRILQKLAWGVGLALIVSMILRLIMPDSSRMAQVLPSPWIALLVLLIASLSIGALQFAFCRFTALRVSVAVLCFGLLVGMGHRLIVLKVQKSLSYSPETLIHSLVAKLGESEKLVSLGPIPARFRYFYPHFIRMIPRKTAVKAWDDTVSHFCIEGEWFRKPTAEFAKKRQSKDIKELPFQDGVVLCGRLDIPWQPVVIVPLGRTPTRDPQAVVIVGHRIDKRQSEPNG